MGVHDFACPLFNPSSDQCLFHYEPISDNPDENLSFELVFRESYEEQDEKDEFSAAEERELLEEHQDKSCGDTRAYLEVVIFDSNVDEIEFDQAVKNKSYKYRLFHAVSYSWDNWDFAELDADEKSFFYDRMTDQNMSVIWHPTLEKIDQIIENGENYISPNLIQWCQAGTVWIRNWSSYAFENVLQKDHWTPELSDLNLLFIADNLSIQYEYSMTRKQLFDKIKDRIGLPLELTPFNKIAIMLAKNELIRFEVHQIMSPNTILKFFDQVGNMYEVRCQYNQVTNQVFPPV